MASYNRIEPDDLIALRRKFSRPPELHVPQGPSEYDRYFPNLERDIIAAGTPKPKNNIAPTAAKQPAISNDAKLAIGAGAAAAGLGAAAMVASQGTEEKPPLIDRVLERINNVFSGIMEMDFKYLFPVTLGVGAIGWLGKKTGSKTITKTGEFLGKPLAAVDTPLGELGAKMKVNTVVGGVAQTIADHSAGPIERAAAATGLGAWRARANAAKAQKHFAATQKIMTSGVEASAHVPAPLATLHRAVADAHSTEQLLHPSVQGALNEMEQIIKGEHPSITLPKEGQLPKNTSNLLSSLSKTVEHGTAARGWKNPASVIKNIPASIAATPTRSLAINTAWIGADAIRGVFTMRQFFDVLDTLKDMDAATSGKGRRSTIGILTADVAKPVRELRSQLLKNIGVKTVTQLAGIGISLKSILSKNAGMMKLFAVQGALQTAQSFAELIVPIESAQMYKSLRWMEKHGQPISEDMVAEFVDAISSDVRSRGGETRPFAYELAKQFKRENASVDTILKEASNGGIMARLKKIVADNEAAKHAAPVQAVTEAPTTSHQDRLVNGGAKPVLPKPEREIVGEHTHKVAQEIPATPALGAGA